MRGRKPPGPEFVQRLHGSAASKERAEIILKTLTGQLRVHEASARLGITPQRLHMLRQAGVQALIDALEPQPMGRPRKEADPAAAATAQLERLQQELEAARLREEIALLLPGRKGAAASPKPRRRRR
jgi:transposase-like protein